MKALLIKLTILTSFVFAFIACNDEGGDTDSRLASVSNLVEPMNADVVTLVPEAAASVYFEWEHCKEKESGAPIYQIAFDKASGDFSNPVYMANSDYHGFKNEATISHKDMNKIAGLMGVGISGTGTFKWTVFSSKGLKAEKAIEERTITVTRLAGFEEFPDDVFLSGEGSEFGNELAKMTSVGSGIFEIYTKLTAGKGFKFTGPIANVPKTFYTENGLIKEDGTSTVATTGVYRITLDFDMGSCEYTLINRISFFFSPDNAYLFDLPYVGNGVFQAKDKTVTFKQEGWGRDERYKFRMFVQEKNGTAAEKEWEWHPVDTGIDGRPSATEPASYYHVALKTSGLDQWNPKWKLSGDFDEKPATYTIYLTGAATYTHSVTK